VKLMTFKIPVQYYMILKEIATREGKSMGEVIRDAIAYYVRTFYSDIAQSVLSSMVVKHEGLRGIGLIVYMCSSCGTPIAVEPGVNYAPAKTTRIIYEFKQCPVCGKQLSNSKKIVFIPTGEIKFGTVKEA